MIQFGMRAHDACRPAPMTEALDAMKAQGLEHLQLAFEKSFSDYDFTTGHYSAGFAHKIGRELAKRDLHVAVLGCYINPVHPDDAARAAEVARFVERLRYAKHCGADMVGTETGRFSPDMSVTDATYGPECYSTLLDSFSTIVDAAERLGVTVGVESVFSHTLRTPEMMDRFLKDIASPAVEVILDAANLVAPWATAPEEQNALINKAFDLYGDRISVLHLKDCVFDEQGVQKCVRPGTGLVCYDALMANIKASKPEIIGLLEESDPEHFAQDCAFFARQLENA